MRLSIEELLKRLHEEGHLEFPEDASSEGEMFTFIKPSEKAKTIGDKARQRVLSQLGLSDAGAYIERERKLIGIKPLEISQRIKLSQEVLREVETGKLPLFRLTARKVADLVDVLNLDPKIILLFLKGQDFSHQRAAQSTSLLRTGKRLRKDQKTELENTELTADQERIDEQESLDRFIQDFMAEISKRGLSE